jgi:hypothetical protein
MRSIFNYVEVTKGCIPLGINLFTCDSTLTPYIEKVWYTDFAIFWKAWEFELLVHLPNYLLVFYGHLVYSTAIWYILWLFGTFWYVVPIKIWQPWP